jgi:hypothetical protein
LLRQFHFLIAGEPGRCAMQISGEPILAQHEERQLSGGSLSGVVGGASLKIVRGAEESQRLDFFLILPSHSLAQMRTAHLP